MYSILYVDDDPDFLDVGKLFLEQAGDFSVDTHGSAKSALDLLKRSSYDAVVSDYMMPGMNGIAFLKEVRSLYDNIPFILFTGKGREEVVIDAINTGVDFYLQKGGDPASQFAELSHKVKAAIERRRAVDALRNSEQRLADIINFLPDATFAIDTEGRVIAWNRAIEEMTGIPAADMLGRGNYEYAIPFYGERRPILVDMIFETGEEITRRFYSIHRKEGNNLIAETSAPFARGSPVTIVGKASILYDKNGNVVGAIESIRDITLQKQAEENLKAAYEQIRESEEILRKQYEELEKSQEALKESESAYRTIFEHIGIATIQVEEDMTISMVNRPFEDLTGYSRKEIERRRKWTEFVAEEDLGKMLQYHHERRRRPGVAPDRYEARLRDQKGAVRRVLLSVGIISGTGKSIVSLWDLTGGGDGDACRQG